MASAYYKPCKEFDICNELIEKYWESKQYDKCFEAGVDGGEGAAVRDFNICESTNCSLERRNNPTIIITKI